MEHGYANSINLATEKNDNKESFIIGVVLLVAFGGLLFLHISKDEANLNNQPNATIVRQQAQAPMAVTAHQTISVEKVSLPGKLVLMDKQPEAKQELTFVMTEFSNGATYSIDTGDGVRKPFVNAKVKHTYQRSGNFYVHLYAEFESQVVELQSFSVPVAPALETVSVPSLDF